MMQILEQGGVELVTDGVRGADESNPRGYYEFEPARRIARDVSWIPACRGKAVKLVSQLLYHLPAGEQYRVIFMDRDLEEVLASQEQMLARRGASAVPRDTMRRSLRIHLERLQAWLAAQPHIRVLSVRHRALLDDAEHELQRVAAFLGNLEVAAMRRAIDPKLYRNRST